MTSKHQSIPLANILTYMGVIPFLCATFISLSPYLNLPESMEISFPGYKARALMHSYAVVILAFLAGIQWGVCLNGQKPTPFLLISNVIALTAWFSLIIFANKIALAILLAGYVLALFTDGMAFKNQLIPGWFWQLRKKASIIVCATILIVLFAS